MLAGCGCLNTLCFNYACLTVFSFNPGGSCTKIDDICQRDNPDCSATVMGSPYIPRLMRLQEQGSSEPSELNYRYNAPTAKNIGDLNGAHSWVQAHPEGEHPSDWYSNINLRLTCEIHGYVPIAHKMIQTSLELLMSQSKTAHAPIFSGSCGEDLTNATKFQVQGSMYPSKGKEDLLCR